MPTQADVNFVLAAVKYRFLDTGKAKELFEMYKVAETSGVKYPISNIAISYGYLTSQQAEQLGKALQVKIDKKKINQIASYRLINKLGAGSMGVVYRAKHVQSGQDVALKILLKRFYDDPDYLERFYREAQASAQLQHPNLIRAIEAGKSKEGYHFFAMEFVDGESVQSILDRETTVPEKRAIEIATQVIRALEHASSRGIVHRDIKPDNLMITKTGVVKVADFGLARETDSSVTQTGIALGTPHYMSPEQVRGEHSVDIRSDLYSTGATLYHMVTGNPPFVGTSAAVVITKHLSEQVTHPKEKNPNLSDGICQIILRMMEKEQADRYQSAAELLQDIDVLINGGSFPQTVANDQLSPVGMSATPNFNVNQQQGDLALQPLAASPTAVAPSRASGRLSLANSSSTGRLGGAGSTSFRSRRRSSAASNRSASIVDNYVKPICIGIAASLLCILTALGIYFTRCLESVAFADEIVVVDTGSQDRSVEIAKSMGAKVFHYEWQDDFAAARNFSMEQATGGWILQMDADEEFHQADIPKLRAILERDDVDGVHLVIRNFFPLPALQTDKSVENPMSYPHSVNHFPRLVRNRPDIRYTGTIHEGFATLDSVLVSDVSIFHYGYAQEDDRKGRRFERNRRMTLKNVEDNPDDPLAHYYAATTCLSSNRHEEAERYFLKMIELSDPEHPRQKHFYQMANAHLATLAVLQHDYETVECFARAAIQPDPGYLDPWLRLGESCFFLEKHWEAERAFRKFLDILKKNTEGLQVTKYTLYLTDEAHYAHFFLGRLAQLRDDDWAATSHYEQSVELRNDIWGPHFFLSELYGAQDDPRAHHHLARAMELNPELRREEEEREEERGGRGEAKIEEVSDKYKNLSVENLHRQARELVMQNQMVEACDKPIHAMQLSPESSGIRSDLGWVQYQLGQIGNAERLWLKALDLDPQNAIARRNLADHYFEARELDSAQSHYEMLLEVFGDQADPELLDGLADVYAGQGLPEKAIPLYQRVLHAVPAASAVRDKLEQMGGVTSNT